MPLFTVISRWPVRSGGSHNWNEMVADPEYKIDRPRQLFTGATRRKVTPIAQST